ncbi:hypothetical protein L7F22_000433 [Adiantum nelumboides]|nr:hypothetical protein [Adiantum nelumboides]
MDMDMMVATTMMGTKIEARGIKMIETMALQNNINHRNQRMNLGIVIQGYDSTLHSRDTMHANPQFSFKVMIKKDVGVGAYVIIDMTSRSNFGLNELDFVFSTIVVGSILSLLLMYMLAPTLFAASIVNSLPYIFAACPLGHMFEQGAYSVLDRLSTFVYKGAVFGSVGFDAGLLGIVISNVLVGMRKKMNTTSEVQVKAPH